MSEEKLEYPKTKFELTVKIKGHEWHDILASLDEVRKRVIERGVHCSIITSSGTRGTMVDMRCKHNPNMPKELHEKLASDYFKTQEEMYEQETEETYGEDYDEV